MALQTFHLRQVAFGSRDGRLLPCSLRVISQASGIPQTDLCSPNWLYLEQNRHNQVTTFPTGDLLMTKIRGQWLRWADHQRPSFFS